MFIDFEKWHGTKNDFLIVWLSDADGDIVLNSIKRQSAGFCDRRSGVGADGILVLHTHQRGDLDPYKLTIINSDGSIAKNCGNGLRCAALCVLKAHLNSGNPRELPEACELEVEGTTFLCRYLDNRTLKTLVAVDMPTASTGKDVPWGAAAITAAKNLLAEAGMQPANYEISVCDIGNPHIIIATEAASRELMLKIGPALQTRCGIDGINVHMVNSGTLSDAERSEARKQLGQNASEKFKMFVWERGAGETMACGSGACAVAVTAMAGGLINRSEWIAVDMPGGRVFIKQEDSADPVTLAGPAAFVYSGKLEF